MFAAGRYVGDDDAYAMWVELPGRNKSQLNAECNGREL